MFARKSDRVLRSNFKFIMKIEKFLKSHGHTQSCTLQKY